VESSLIRRRKVKRRRTQAREELRKRMKETALHKIKDRRWTPRTLLESRISLSTMKY